MRSFLFAPGDSERKLEKALTSGADAVIVDLEDSVGPDRKAVARESAAVFLQNAVRLAQRPRLIVRINSLPSGLADADLDCVVAPGPDAILLPKAEGAASVIHLDAKLTAREAMHGLTDGHIEIFALGTESASALFRLGSYGDAGPRLAGLTWGAEDLSADLGAEANRDAKGDFLEPYRLARVLCLMGAVAARVQPIDTVYVDFRNEAGLRREAEEARRDGFTGKMAIHPAQVSIINDVFTPTRAAVARAGAIIAAFEAAPGAGVVGIDGVMYDQPHLKRAQQLLARAKAAGVT
jgi:citrate lyase subunit beta/citryl-CoA lyase